MPQSLIVISFATVSFVIIMIQLITYAELVSGNPSVLDVSIDDTLTIKWTAQCSGRNHEEVTNIIYGCTQGGIPIKDSDLMTIQSRNDAHGPAKKYLEKELPIPANMSLTTGGNWTCVFKLKGEQNRDCLTEDSVCVLVDAQSFSGISDTCLPLERCSESNNEAPRFQPWIKRNGIPCAEGLIGIAQVRKNLTKIPYHNTTNSSDERVCINPNIYQIIEMCTAYVEDAEGEPVRDVSSCNSQSFIKFKSKLVSSDAANSESQVTLYTSTAGHIVTEPSTYAQIPNNSIAVHYGEMKKQLLVFVTCLFIVAAI